MESTKKNPIIKYIIIAAVAILAIGGIFYFSQGKSKAEPVSISGEIDFNGIKPSDASNPELGEINLLAKERGSSDEYKVVLSDIPFEDKAPFVWDGAELDKTYDLKAEVKYKGYSIKKTNTTAASAPAEGIVLVFHVTNDDIPDEISGETQENQNELSTISGTIRINGFIPTGSVVNVYGRKAGTSDKFVEALSNLPASSNMSISYDQAVTGEHYEYQAELYDSAGNFIGQSSYIQVTAPASNELITINSTATAPTQKSSIKGNISLNGQLDQNSTILLLQRKTGQSDYKVVNRYPANRSIDYEWKDAESGVHYDITAALQVNETNTATGNVRTVVAPATNVDIRIDTNFSLPAPTSTPTLTCGDPDQTNHFNARISVPQMSNAKKYHLEVGTSAGANNTFNGSLNPNETATVYIPADSPYFTRYAYTSCTDCQINESSNWSGWSPTLGFKCPQ